MINTDGRIITSHIATRAVYAFLISEFCWTVNWRHDQTTCLAVEDDVNTVQRDIVCSCQKCWNVEKVQYQNVTMKWGKDPKTSMGMQ